ncbi:hypothetical protein AUC31_17565 [Planococcus rifietoensis]|uniref:BppU N-terminal domain-containing protein n=1 Tax=Planococcus rifietoensis TaxID=200991 RepID=A0A0U2J6C2_9BACL|nr:hypothetical protein [Planococcus rifietoensis]ALS76917.1 hypothetical protein AUC31_17565 [Planococcus rifietoensis]
MNMTNHTRLDLVEGGSIFKQGEHAQLAFNPRDYSGKTVDLTGKDIAVAIWNDKGIMYEGTASFDSTVQLIRLTINQLLQHGDFQIEFTATDAANPDYRRKFPSGEYEGKIYIKPSTDNLEYAGISVTTVSQLRTEQEEKQQQFEQAIVPQVDELKQRVDEGVGAFTEDTEVLDARMGEFNLRAYNEKVDNQLNQRSLYDLILEHNQITSGILVKKKADRRFDVAVPLGGKKYAVYYLYKDIADDYIKLSSGSVSTLEEDDEWYLNENADEYIGTWNKLSPPSYYTTEIGAKYVKSFKGSRIDVKHYTDDRGGDFNVTIDGVFHSVLSTHINNVPSEELQSTRGLRVIDGLEDKEHLIEFEFIGANSMHPPAGGIARGWSFFEERSELSARTFEIYEKGFIETESFKLLEEGSNKEFALRVQPIGVSTSTEWLPDHGLGTVFSVSQTVLFDGIAITDWTPSKYERISQVVIMQSMACIYPHTGQKIANLSEVKTINVNGASFKTSIKWIEDVYVSSGYVGMFPVSRQFADRLYTSLGTDLDATNSSGGRTELSEKALSREYAFYHNSTQTEKRNYAVAMKFHNIAESLRYGKANRYNDPHVVWLEHRNADMQKLYPQVLDNHTFNKGEVYRFGASFVIGRLFEAEKLLK